MQTTKEEREWLAKFRRLVATKPGPLKAYSTDSDVIICKEGVPSDEWMMATGLQISFGAFLPDLHDRASSGGY